MAALLRTPSAIWSINRDLRLASASSASSLLRLLRTSWLRFHFQARFLHGGGDDVRRQKAIPEGC